MRKIIGVTVGTPTSPTKMERELNPVKTVNGQTPDENGNVEFDIPEEFSGSWNDLKHRPFGIETVTRRETIVEEVVVTPDAISGAGFPQYTFTDSDASFSDLLFREGCTNVFTIGGMEYSIKHESNATIIGNKSLMAASAPDTGESFCLRRYSDVQLIIYTRTADPYTFALYEEIAENVLVKLDESFIPETIVRREELLELIGDAEALLSKI